MLLLASGKSAEAKGVEMKNAGDGERNGEVQRSIGRIESQADRRAEIESSYLFCEEFI